MNLTLKEMFGLANIEVPTQFQNIEFPSHAATDSRDVKSGDAFIALEGEKTDGHKFIPQAISNGAKIIIAKKNKNLDIPDSIPVIELDNPEKNLAFIASERLKKFKPKEIIAITGSVGKTTTRTALENVLKSKFKIHAPEKSFNTLLTCSTTVLAMPIETEILLLEFGANKPGEIKELTQFFSPTIAILTAVAPVHLEGFKTIEGVLHEKLEITHSKNIKKIFFNNDIELLRSLKHVSVGQYENSDYKISFEKSNYELPALSFTLNNTKFKANVWGKHVAMPLSLAAAAGDFLGIPLEKSSEILNNFKALSGRGRIVNLKNNVFLVDDAYNANPMSMRASLETFTEINCKKLAILGEMREMGSDAAKYHRDLKNLIEKIDFVILVGNTWRDALPEFSGENIFVENWQQALELLKDILSKNNIQGILSKGSNSIGLSNIVKYLEENL